MSFDFAAVHGTVIETSGNDLAVYSEDRKYRYLLVRRLAAPVEPGQASAVPKAKRIGFLMLNPSTATAFRNDPTITRVVNFAKREGAEELWVCNAAAFRSTDPNALMGNAKAVGARNIQFLEWQMRECSIVVCGWGGHKWTLSPYAAPVMEFLKSERYTGDLRCLGLTKFGAPRHPLYLGSTSPLRKWPAHSVALAAYRPKKIVKRGRKVN